MSTEQANNMDSGPSEVFSAVWVKMEVDEDGTVEGIDDDHQDTEDNYQETEDDGQDTEEDDQDSGDNYKHSKKNEKKCQNIKKNWKDTEENSQERCLEPVTVPVRRSRRKPVAPRKAKNVIEQRFQCDYCDYKALHKSSLKYHLMKHTKPDPLSCSVCTYTTNHAPSLKRHMLAVHTDKNDPVIQAMPDIKCKDCDFTCKFSWKLFIHRRKHVEKSFQCDQCDFATARKSNFDKHFKTHKHKSGVTYECDKCPFVTKHEGHISRHLAVIHKEVSIDASKCDFCEFTTKVRWRLNIHKKNSHQERPIKCEFCDFVTDYNCQYKLHKNQHINDMALVASGIELPKDQQNALYNIYKTPKGKSANVSDTSFEMPTGNEKEFIVDTTCEEVDWRSIEVAEKPGQEKPFHCILCQYKSKFKASVQRHFQRNHTSENSKPYKCVNCGFSTKTRDQISLHNKRSKSNYIITCKACDFSTFYKCQMAEHQRLHWRFKCKLCDFICRVSYDLNQHYTVVHLGQGLKCRFCDFQAARKGSLLNHENTHTNKRFRCGLCDYSATRRNLLFNHLKRNHAGEKPKIIISDRKFEFLQQVNESQSENVNDDSVKCENVVRGKIDSQLKYDHGIGGGNDSSQSEENLKHDEFDSQLNVESVLHVENDDNVENDIVESVLHVENDDNVENDTVESNNKFKRFQSEENVKYNKYIESVSNVNDNNVERKDKYEGFQSDESVKFDSQFVESVSNVINVNNVESKHKFETQVYVQRQNEYDIRSPEFQNNIIGNELGNSPRGNMGIYEPRQNAFYPM